MDSVNSKDEYKELLRCFQEELDKCFDLAQRLDSLNPEIEGAFTGSPSERIKRQLKAKGLM